MYEADKDRGARIVSLEYRRSPDVRLKTDAGADGLGTVSFVQPRPAVAILKGTHALTIHFLEAFPGRRTSRGRPGGRVPNAGEAAGVDDPPRRATGWYLELGDWISAGAASSNR